MTLAHYAPQAQQFAPGNGIAVRQASQPALPAQVASLAEWAQSAQAAFQVAEMLVTTPFVPEAFRNKPHDAAGAILAGGEVGLSPMASLRSFDVIQGTAAPRAMTLRAIVQSRGHEVWVEESTDARAIVCGRRAGSAREQRSEWTIQRARGLNLLSKHNWKAQPAAMLVARATAELCRLIASDAILGLAYTVEELADGEVLDEPPAPGVAAGGQQGEKPRRTAQRRTSTAPAKPAARATSQPSAPPASGPPLPGEDGFDNAEPAQADDPAEPENAAEDEPMVSRAQLDKLHTQLGKLGIDDKASKLTTVGLLAAGGAIDSSSDLTKRQATRVIDQLETCLQDAEPGKALDAALAAVEDQEAQS